MCVCVCVCVCVLLQASGGVRKARGYVGFADHRLGSGHPRLRSLFCRKAPIGVGHALFVLSDHQLTRIFNSANNLLCCASQIVCVCVCVFVCTLVHQDFCIRPGIRVAAALFCDNILTGTSFPPGANHLIDCFPPGANPLFYFLMEFTCLPM